MELTDAIISAYGTMIHANYKAFVDLFLDDSFIATLFDQIKKKKKLDSEDDLKAIIVKVLEVFENDPETFQGTMHAIVENFTASAPATKSGRSGKSSSTKKEADPNVPKDELCGWTQKDGSDCGNKAKHVRENSSGEQVYVCGRHIKAKEEASSGSVKKVSKVVPNKEKASSLARPAGGMLLGSKSQIKTTTNIASLRAKMGISKAQQEPEENEDEEETVKTTTKAPVKPKPSLIKKAASKPVQKEESEDQEPDENEDEEDKAPAPPKPKFSLKNPAKKPAAKPAPKPVQKKEPKDEDNQENEDNQEEDQTPPSKPSTKVSLKNFAKKHDGKPKPKDEQLSDALKEEADNEETEENNTSVAEGEEPNDNDEENGEQNVDRDENEEPNEEETEAPPKQTVSNLKARLNQLKSKKEGDKKSSEEN